MSLELFFLPKVRNVLYKFNLVLIKEKDFLSNIQQWWKKGDLGGGSEMFIFKKN